MTTISQILASQLTWGSLGVVFLLLFGLAIQFEWNGQLTPRARNRPHSILKNALKDCKLCGYHFYPLTWLQWAWLLTYPRGLDGIPGTGTRNGGWAGPTLRWNLDQVILLKYHRMLFKVSVLATILCICVLLPVYRTSKCNPELLGATCRSNWNNTDFENLTIAHVPDKVWTNPNNESIWITLPNGTAMDIAEEPPNPIEGMIWVPGTSSRTLTVVVCCLIIYLYTCFLLWYEWIDNLALRRVYFLESDHYPRRVHELDEIATVRALPQDNVQKDRPPYIPDPELRDTPPSVGLYSVLYQLPESLVTFDTDGATPAERQMMATVKFFDEAVACQPGFSSSVVAVTIVPDAGRVAKCWMKWYKIETKLRRLRYVKRILQEKLEKEAQGRTDMYDTIADIVKHSKHEVQTAAKTVVNTVVTTTSAALSNSRHSSKLSVRADDDGRSSTSPNAEKEGDELHALVEHKDENGTPESTTDETKAVENAREEEQTQERAEKSGKDDGDNAEIAELDEIHSDAGTDKEKDTNASTGDEENGFVSLLSNWMGGSANNTENKKADEGDAVEKASEMAEENDNSKNPISDIESQGVETAECVPLTPNGSHSDLLSTAQTPANKKMPAKNSTCDTTQSENDTKNEFRKNFEYETFDVVDYAKKLGFDEEARLVDIIDGLGIEELSVFAREYAQSSANPCVYGPAPQLLKFASIEELREAEEDLWEELREANEQLLAARAHAVEGNDDDDGLVVSGLELKDSSDGEEEDGSGDIEIPSRSVQRSSSEINVPAALQRFSSEAPGLRNRAAGNSLKNQWDMAEETAAGMRFVPESEISRGPGSLAWWRAHVPCCGENLKAIPKYYGYVKGSGKAFITAMDHPTYAVVTFSSRQAAIAARQCLADGSATNVWRQVDDIPIPPLADAPPRNIFFFRGCCRPVTLTINYKEKKLRRWSMIVFLFFFMCLYTIPLAWATRLLDPDTYIDNKESPFYQLLAGPLSGLVKTLFFSFLPQLFKFLAFYEGTSSSMEKAERISLLLYFYFMVVTAFTGTSLATMLLNWFYGETTTEEGIRNALNTAANALITTSGTWLNWIIMRYSFTWPGGYLFQMNTFLTKIFNLKWLNRVMRGGGPGSPVPYRIYVDSGVVFMCITALAPACPLIAPAAMIYFIIVQPILRWLVIFVYRPKYDGGGDKWPQLHQIIIASLILGQILMAVTLSLKAAYWEALLLGLSAVPTYLYNLLVRERFLRPYHDAALLQTSRLDGWQDSHSMREREEYRRWLVDCHKASYVPVCLLGSKENLLTAEPAVVIPRESDEDRLYSVGERRQRLKRQSAQKGAIFNRKYR